MATLGALHYIYIAMIFAVIITMILKKDTVLPCIVGLFVIGYASSGNLLKAVQVIYNALITSGKEFWGIIVIISLVVAMSRVLKDMGADELMMSPVRKLMVNKNIAFLVLGTVMMVVSWFVWPSPAVALVGAIMLPAAVKTGLPAVWAASAMNLFGHGIALSSDYFIQGAPSITAKAAGLKSSFDIMNGSLPLWITMSTVTVITAFFMMKREMKAGNDEKEPVSQNINSHAKYPFGTWFMAIITPIVFFLDAYLMLKYKLKGGDATALIGGTAVIIMAIASVVHHRLADSLEKVTDYVRDGFTFGIKIFAPVVVIGAFFFLGSEDLAKEILGPNATGLLTDIGRFLADRVPLSKFPVVVVQASVGAITGLDGSGFSGLPLVGALSQTFSSAVSINKEGLAALGQITAIWVGGGTIIPWGVIPVAAICNVEPLELVRRNIIPVGAGFIATIIVALIIL